MLFHDKEKKKRERKTKDSVTISLILSFSRNYVQISMGTDLGAFCINKHETTWQILASISSLTLTKASTKLYLNYLLKRIYFAICFTVRTFQGILIRKQNLRKYNGFHGSKTVRAFSNFYCPKKPSWSLMKR